MAHKHHSLIMCGYWALAPFFSTGLTQRQTYCTHGRVINDLLKYQSYKRWQFYFLHTLLEKGCLPTQPHLNFSLVLEVLPGVCFQSENNTIVWISTLQEVVGRQSRMVDSSPFLESGDRNFQLVHEKLLSVVLKTETFDRLAIVISSLQLIKSMPDL